MKRKGKCTENNMKFFSLSYLYQKTISFGALPNATTKTVAHGISNVKKIISMSGYSYRSSDNKFFPVDRAEIDDNATMISCDKTSIYIQTNTDRSNITECYITLKYTK